MRVRHLVRIVVLVAIASLVLLNEYFSLRGQMGGQEIINRSAVYSKMDEWIGTSPHLEPYETFAQGSLWSGSIRDFRLSDPLTVFSAPDAPFLPILVPIVLALLLGRVFCGWVCPMGLLSEFVAGIRRVLAWMGLDFFAFPLSNRLKYAILAIGVGFAVTSSVSFFYTIYPPRIVSDMVRDSLLSTIELYAAVFIGAILLVELLFVERLWCRCLCPGGAVYSILGRGRFLRIRRDKGICTDCGDCDKACPHELEPSHELLGGECDNCGLCRRSCKPRALHYSWSSQGKQTGDT